MTADRPARFPWRVYWLLLVVILLFAAAPILSVLLGGFLAETHGCVLNEGSINPCLIGGADWGATLYTLFVLGWFALVTLPLGGGALVVWLVILIIHRIAWGRMQKVRTP